LGAFDILDIISPDTAEMLRVKQDPKYFDQDVIELEAVREFESLVLVLNGDKSLTLFNWVRGRPMQSWTSSSPNSIKLSGCTSKNTILILENKGLDASFIHAYKISGAS
jgi:hypothetical protein